MVPPQGRAERWAAAPAVVPSRHASTWCPTRTRRRRTAGRRRCQTMTTQSPYSWTASTSSRTCRRRRSPRRSCPGSPRRQHLTRPRRSWRPPRAGGLGGKRGLPPDPGPLANFEELVAHGLAHGEVARDLWITEIVQEIPEVPAAPKLPGGVACAHLRRDWPAG